MYRERRTTWVNEMLDEFCYEDFMDFTPQMFISLAQKLVCDLRDHLIMHGVDVTLSHGVDYGYVLVQAAGGNLKDSLFLKVSVWTVVPRSEALQLIRKLQPATGQLVIYKWRNYRMQGSNARGRSSIHPKSIIILSQATFTSLITLSKSLPLSIWGMASNLNMNVLRKMRIRYIVSMKKHGLKLRSMSKLMNTLQNWNLVFSIRSFLLWVSNLQRKKLL